MQGCCDRVTFSGRMRASTALKKMRKHKAIVGRKKKRNERVRADPF
jgi:hypothetical protein